MPEFSITDLAKIIERDSKDATYKFALLRGTIELIQEHAHYKTPHGDQISYPIGLLLVKWIEYYYPLISYYPGSKDAYAFLYDLKKGITRPDLHEATRKLIQKLRTTIIKQPMHYIGSAIGRGGEIYTNNKDAKRLARLDSLESIINDSGTFSIPSE